MANTLDQSQRPIVEAGIGYHLVLAPPGCGKTHILAERIKYAHTIGVNVEDMLCLTFTNRAAREMVQRITTIMGQEVIDRLQVGNVHHFCSKFLFESGKIEADSSIIDDEEAVSIIADFKQEDEESVLRDFNRNKVYQTIIFFAHYMVQVEKQHPKQLFLHPECFTSDDKEALKILCQIHRMPVECKSLIHFYRYAQDYLDEIKSVDIDWGASVQIQRLLWKMYYAACYTNYKQGNHMLDFEDLLLKTYEVYKTDDSCHHYSWIQVDEVQDLNGMQLAIIDLLTAPNEPIVMYLGDEQQAIFSFMGAKIEVLEQLKERCCGHIHHLVQNHRSPDYLLRIFNDYAEHQLGIDQALLPETKKVVEKKDDFVRLLHYDSLETELTDVVNETTNLHQSANAETIALIVSANTDADHISEEMERHHLSHFKVSGRDLFDTPEVKLLLAHLTVLANEHHFIAWTRLLKGLKVFESFSMARRFERKLKQLAISPTDFLLYEDSTYIQEFHKTWSEKTFVVFDTETTGLNVEYNDIIEISAMKVKNGKIIGEPLDLYIETTQDIPPLLGDIVNPMTHIYDKKKRQAELLQPAAALRQFMRYTEGCVVIGHNVEFDIQIFQNCWQKYVGHDTKMAEWPVFDTLKLMRLLEPHLKSYRLESLLAHYKLEGVNSHRAIDDVKATVSLLQLCFQKTINQVEAQKVFMTHQRVRPYINKLKNNYKTLFLSAYQQLYSPHVSNVPAIIWALQQFYQGVREQSVIGDIPRWSYVLHYIQQDMLSADMLSATLRAQLDKYLLELNTLKESDFCNSKSIREKVYVTTVHKAKGLEFDNVIIFDAVDGRYPNYYSNSTRSRQEDARKFYVAMSRAKKRLWVTYSTKMIDWHGGIHERKLSPFMECIIQYFRS